MSKPKVYLAGPIGGLSYAEATDWRQEAKAALDAVGIAAFSPMRAKDFLKDETKLTWLMDHWQNPMATSKGIMARDHSDCITANAVLFNFLGAKRVSLGSAMELAWCYDRHIPTIVVAEHDNPNIAHPMAHEAINFRVDTLEQGLEIIRHVLLPESKAV